MSAAGTYARVPLGEAFVNASQPERGNTMATRTVLVHLNVQVPEDAPATAYDVEHEIRAALEVGIGDGEYTPTLIASRYDVTLAEEV